MKMGKAENRYRASDHRRRDIIFWYSSLFPAGKKLKSSLKRSLEKEPNL
jgi:hypothetical protein